MKDLLLAEEPGFPPKVLNRTILNRHNILILSQINIQTDIEQVFVGKYFGVIQGQGKIVIVSFTGTVIVASFSKNSTIGLNVDLTQKKYRNYNFVVEGFVEETLDFLSAALQYQENGKPTGSENITRRMGIVGNLNYSFDDRYYVDFAYRTDGSSQFGKDKKFAPFYSAGIGWNIHNEKFMKSVDFIDRLKLRTSYGQTGSQNFSAYQAICSVSKIYIITVIERVV